VAPAVTAGAIAFAPFPSPAVWSIIADKVISLKKGVSVAGFILGIVITACGAAVTVLCSLGFAKKD